MKRLPLARTPRSPKGAVRLARPPAPVPSGPVVSAQPGTTGATVLDDLARDPEVAQFLQRERALADRTGRGFAWIACRAGRGAQFEAVEREVRASLRSSDLVLRVPAGPLLVVFPATGRDAADRAFRRALERLGAHATVAYESGFVGHADRPVRQAARDAGPIDRPPAPGIRWERRGVAVLLARPLPIWKRAMDVLVASTGLLLTSPLMLLIAVGIKLSSPGPVLYEQWRTGHLFRRFRIYKFRTMKPRSDKAWGELQHLNQMSGPLFKSDHDPRIHRFGKLLRKTSLDELPQLLNVLRGDMTLIGPRALSPEPAKYEPWQLRRFDVVPGVACTWQAYRRGETSFDDWMRSDLAWVDRHTGFLEDVRLLVATGVAVLRCAGGR